MASTIARRLSKVAWQAYRVVDGLRAISNKTDVIRHVLGRYLRTECVYELKHGIRLAVSNARMDRTAIFSVQEIFNDEVYHIPGCEASRVIVDLGANIGAYTLYSSWKHPAARIYAVEPDMNNFRQLRKNVTLNGLDARVSVINVALAASEGEVTFFRNSESSRGHSLAQIADGEDGVRVQSMSLERLFESFKIENCDLLKMDIEGAEYQVLFNCRPEFLRRIKVMAIEYHPLSLAAPVTAYDRSHFCSESLAAFLRENGFTTEKKRHDILFAIRK